MNESIGVVSAVGVLTLTMLVAAALTRFLVWRDGLRSRSIGPGRETEATSVP